MAKLFIPDEFLEKLRCSGCNFYLSIFPCHIKTDGGSPLCGRCKIPNEDDYLRDEAYEGIAQFLIFPCAQKDNGCKEMLTPQKLKDHEYCCTNRKVDCPSKNLSRCNWQGPNKDLKAHFEGAHTSLILSNKRFEIQFLNSIKENLLMPHEDEVFIVKKEIDSRSGLFVCSVEHIVQNEEPQAFNYYVRAETGNSTYSHKFPEYSTIPNSDEKTKFSFEFIRDQLHDPSTIVACVEIVKTGLKKDQPVVKTEIKSPDVNWDLLGELECPVCLEYMLSPIYQCVTGHSICLTCKRKVDVCPLCQSRIEDTQNFSLGKLAERLVYPCKYHKVGCSVALKSSEIRVHEGSCEFGPYNCPLAEVEACKEKANKSEILAHIENNHDAFILKSDKVNVPFVGGREGQQQKYYIIQFDNNTFKMCFKYENQKFYWALQLIGPAEECPKFKFEIDVIDNSDKNLRHYARGMCVPLTTNDESFLTKGNYIYIALDQISDFISNHLSYRVRVVKE